VGLNNLGSISHDLSVSGRGSGGCYNDVLIKPLSSPHRYNKLAGMVKSLSCKLKELDRRDPFRNETTTQLLEKL